MTGTSGKTSSLTINKRIKEMGNAIKTVDNKVPVIPATGQQIINCPNQKALYKRL
ncbi:hypothetical protein AB4Y30_06340 [Ornithinibacillus sp. 4-3]|uniref:Uncharacterized protein n=1 Tax=Ornithinibacillus sp. 4-3 TaxID=3231488 RepID=A0AB39HQL4_9BACI